MSLCSFWFTSPCLLSSSLNISTKVTTHHLLSCFLTTLHNYTYPLHDSLYNPHENQYPLQFDLFDHFPPNGSFSNPYFLNKFVSFSAKSGSFHLGTQLHSTVIKMGFFSNVYISTSLVDMYAKCGEMEVSRNLFDEMPLRNGVTWNSLIFGYLDAACQETTVDVFREMLREAVDVSPLSVSACLVGCSQLEAVGLGAQVHGLIVKSGYDGNVIVSTNLIDLYSKCWEIDNARQVFDHVLDKNVITWTSMVNGYVRCAQPDQAMILAKGMMRLGVGCNYITYSSLLSSLSDLEYYDCCKQVHCCVIRQGFESNVYIVASLVTVYSNCGNSLDDFNKLCTGITRFDQVLWNAILGGYCNLGFLGKAIICFCEMRESNIDIDSYTFTSLLGAIGNSLALDKGKEVHALIFKTGYASHLYVQNGLVSMYATCGASNDSKRVFWSMDKHDVISWNSLLSGCGLHGHGREVVELFERMRKSGIQPDRTTFLSVLSACSHAGFLNKGLEYFELMRTDSFLEPLGEGHYCAIVDIFSRAGYLREAEAFMNEMPIEPGPSVYKALLSACVVHGNREIALHIAKRLLKRFPDDPATYVLLSSLFANEGNWDEAADIWDLICDREVAKMPGYSWI